jgi:hypothetical protein
MVDEPMAIDDTVEDDDGTGEVFMEGGDDQENTQTGTVADTTININISSSAEQNFSELITPTYFLSENEIYCKLPTFTIEEQIEEQTEEPTEEPTEGGDTTDEIKTYNALNINTGNLGFFEGTTKVKLIQTLNISCISE